jgi:hypothetical protein
MTDFRKIVSSQEDMAEELPLIHTSLSENLDHFVASHKIEAAHCDVFNENLVYLFYGRPAYRSKKGQVSGESVRLCPVCFVFKPYTVSKRAYRVFPCDSGALSNHIFNPPLTVEDLKDLELEPRIESARRLVPLLFENNHNYYVGKARTSRPPFSTGSPGQQFHELLLKKGPVGYDDRKSAIEVQVKKHISLRDQLLFVILPGEFLDTDNIKRTIFADWRCYPIPYETTMGDAPSAYYAVIRELLRQHLEKARWL